MSGILWWPATMDGGPLDGAKVRIPLRSGRIDHWIWAHECVLWNSEEEQWQWAQSCVSGFYQLGATLGSTEVDANIIYTYQWHDLRLVNTMIDRWEHGD